MYSFLTVLVLLLCSTIAAFGQSIPRSGTRFTFAIPEGADRVSPVVTPSKIVLNVLSPYDGQGVIWSPSGATIPFTFSGGQAKELQLPYNLILLNDIGKSQKGIVVRTTQPVNLTLHDVLDHAGEATQIWPDEALDTNYLVPAWGIWNDVDYGENNRTQITVVARDNNTIVTVTPTVNCIGGEMAGIPSTMTLQRGECYVLKADTSHEPRQFSLFRSRVSSNKPVSVLTSTTCAYVPLALQSCNQLLDHILPLKNVGTEFYVSPPTDIGHKCRVLFISESPTFFVFSSGSTAMATNGRAEIALSQPSQFQTSEPAQCYLLTNGSDTYYLSDPSIVTVLPIQEYYDDTLYWYSPEIFVANDGSMISFVSLIYPTADEANVLLDDISVGLFPTVVQIPNTTMSAAIMAIPPGEHQITSPAPVFGLAHAFVPADAYSFLIMGRGDRIKIDDPLLDIGSLFENSRTCEVFSGKVMLNNTIDASDDIHRLRVTFTYDPTKVTLVRAQPIGLLTGLGVTLDTSNAGTIIANVISDPAPIVGSGDLLAVEFYGKRAGVTSVTSRISVSQLEFVHLETSIDSYTESFDVEQSRYQGQAAMSVVTENVVLNSPTLAHVFLDEPVNGLFSEVRVRISYDHDLLELVELVEANTKLFGWNVSSRKIDFETDEYIFTPASSALIQGNGALTRFRFMTYVSTYDTTTICASASLTSADLCPLDIEGTQGAVLFEGIDTCSMPSIHRALRSLPFEFLDITPNPTAGTVDVIIRHKLETGYTVTCMITDLTGKKLWTTQADLQSAPEAHLLLSFPSWITSGTYLLSVEAAGHTASRQVVVAR